MSFRTPEALVPHVVTRSFFVLQGGPTLVVETPRPPDAIRPAEVAVACGRTDLADYRDLVVAMAAARVGLQGNCQARPSGADIPEEETLFQWFGRGRRQNTFVVTSRETGDPPCPVAVVALVRELNDYFFALQRAGIRQTLAVPTAQGE